jgi:hypothetical protein
MKFRACLSVLCLLLLSAGCYHATITTGLPLSNEVITKPFASCWIYGLIPPSTVETAAKCPHGVAKVETQLSFVNSLVGMITAGIYTPMTITVTCAESAKMGANDGSEMLMVKGSSQADVRDAFAEAAERSMETGHPVYVQLP